MNFERHYILAISPCLSNRNLGCPMKTVVTSTIKVCVLPIIPSITIILMVPLANAMRFKDSQEQKAYLRHASQAGNVELVYAGLDVLGSTPWKINRSVFDIVLKVWNSGE